MGGGGRSQENYRGEESTVSRKERSANKKREWAVEGEKEEKIASN